ncbi:MAG: exonuclease SbcCD subunit D [bacterium]
MKLAVTADIHLTFRKAYPERYHALEDILKQLLTDGVKTLIVAGDLFDESIRNYAEFEALCTAAPFADIQFLIIPGNHDVEIQGDFFTAQNVEIISEPTIKTFGSSNLKFFLLPYRADKTMGEFIAEYAEELPDNKWVLFAHGDWSEGLRERNPYEPGVYMPLSRRDIETYRPYKVILGHIHKPLDTKKVSYVGSPCGLDIKETGRRRFLVMDSNTGRIKPRRVHSDFLYFNESFIILPVKDEAAFVRRLVQERIEEWDLESHEIPKARVSVRFSGYTANKSALLKNIIEAFRGIRFYKDWQPDLSNVAVSDDLNLAEIANRVSGTIEKMDWTPGLSDPSKEDILLEALRVIYEY